MKVDAYLDLSGIVEGRLDSGQPFSESSPNSIHRGSKRSWPAKPISISHAEHERIANRKIVPMVSRPQLATELRRWSMLNVNLQAMGSVAILRCQGRIVAGDENTIMRNVSHSQLIGGTLVLDLAAVAGIDGGGLGALLRLQMWTHSNGIQFKLMNVPNALQQVLDVTNLDRVLEIWSEKDLIDLLHPAGMLAARPSD